VEVLELMKYKKVFETLPQLDRIEYLQQVNLIDGNILLGLIFFLCSSLFGIINNFVGSFFFWVCAIYFLIKSILNSLKLKDKYFKVVKK